MYCPTNSDQYNNQNYAFKGKAFECDAPNLQYQSVSVSEFTTSLADEKNDLSKDVYFNEKRHCYPR